MHCQQPENCTQNVYVSGCQPFLYWYTLSNLSENLYTLAIALKFSAVKV